MRRHFISVPGWALCGLTGLLILIGFLWPYPLPFAAAQTCSFSLTPANQNFAAGGGSGSVVVTAASPACNWTATSNAPWLSITAGAAGTGNGTVAYAVTPNSTTL